MRDWSSSDHIEYVRDLVYRGGPEPDQYAEVDKWIRCFYAATDAESLNGETLSSIRQAMASVLSPATMHGWAYCKPYGYAGDFEIIDRHYLNYLCFEPHLARWDKYWQSSSSANAVRNRKSYFHATLRRRLRFQNPASLAVLNVACGSARDIFEFLSRTDADIHFNCIDHDPRAIRFASNLCRPFAERVTFSRANVVRLHDAKQYDVIWAAGLFDYFSDSLFKRVLRRLLSFLIPGGELIVGNFSPGNPNISWLRFCEWNLQHRTAEQLRELAIDAGIQADYLKVGNESEEINLFLHVCKQL